MKFDDYIAQGDEAVKLHPDLDSLEYETAASDMISNILHAVFDSDRESVLFESVEALLDNALNYYFEDQEDRQFEKKEVTQ